MNCLKCLSPSSRIIESRYQNEIKKRIRQCKQCDHRWTTHEIVVEEHRTFQNGFTAKITVGKREMVIGTYKTPEEAKRAEIEALGALG